MFCSPPFSRDDDSLSLSLPAHSRIGIFRYSEQVRFQFTLSSATVSLYNLRSIEGDTLEGIDCNKHDTTVCVDAVLRITIPDRMEHYEVAVSFMPVYA